MGYSKRSIVLTEDQRRYLIEYTAKGVKPVQAIKRAHILLETDSAQGRRPSTEKEIAEKVGVRLPTIKSVKKAFRDHQGDVEKVVMRKKREMGPREIKMTGDVEAHLIALCCSPAPEGYSRWTVRLLADKMVELNYIEEISPMTISRTLKKNELKPRLKRYRTIPALHNGDFVAAKEDVLTVYALPYDAKRPVVCMDEKPLQLLDHKRNAIPMERGKPLREDSEYIRRGTCSIFMFNEPLGSYRYVDAKEHRTKEDWAHQVKRLVNEDYPDADAILLVMDNLNTHKLGSLYSTFAPEEAFRIASALRFITHRNMAVG